MAMLMQKFDWCMEIDRMNILFFRVAARYLLLLALTMAQVAFADGNRPDGYTRAEYIQGDGSTCDVVTDCWYHDDAGNSLLVDPEPSIRLLGKVAVQAGFDALIHAGDFSTAIPIRTFDEGDYLNEIRNVKAMVSEYLPDTPFLRIQSDFRHRSWLVWGGAGESTRFHVDREVKAEWVG